MSVQAAHTNKGAQPRLVVSHRDEFEPGRRYHAYGQRGQGANLIKECKHARTGERLSWPRFLAHCWRLPEHAGADRLMRALRSAAPALHSELGWPQFETMRRRKLAALVRQSVRRILVQLPRALPCAARCRSLALCTSGAGVT